MEPTTGWALISLAAAIGVMHTLMGPDHYVPFIALARGGGWSLRKTMLVTLTCGAGHVAGSVLLGFVGIGLGWVLGGIEMFESARGELAGWLLLSVGIVYTAWGVRRAIRNRPHSHVHVHADGTIHRHEHTHHADHVHVHTNAQNPARVTPWVLFIVFIFGPCEPLIPLLMFPAIEHSVALLITVALVFTIATIGTMSVMVLLGYAGLAWLRWERFERFSHVIAGVAVTACGLAIKLGL